MQINLAVSVLPYRAYFASGKSAAGANLPLVELDQLKSGMWKRKQWKRSFFCGSGRGCVKILPLLLPHRLFDLKSNLARKFCPYPDVN